MITKQNLIDIYQKKREKELKTNKRKKKKEDWQNQLTIMEPERLQITYFYKFIKILNIKNINKKKKKLNTCIKKQQTKTNDGWYY